MSEQEKSNWYDRRYKLLMVIPIIIVILSLIYLGYFYYKNNDFIYKDVSLTGGTTVTLNQELNDETESKIKSSLPDISIRKLTDIKSGKNIADIIETSAESEKAKKVLEEILGYELTEENSSIEFTGSSLSQSFYKQLLLALIISFILMSIVVFFLFRSFIPSVAVIFAAFSDIVMPLALINYLGIKISAAGISAFLMLIGYSVDTDILLTSRVLKKRDGTVNSRIFWAFKTGILMTMTALFAVIPAFFIVSGLPDSFRNIFFILSLGLIADIFNTWFTNAGIIKWYSLRRGMK